MNQTTPGVYINESDTFSPSIVGVPTAIPAFVGYTEKAEIEGKPVFLMPVQIGSLAEYEAIFGAGFPTRYEIVEITAVDEIDNGAYDLDIQDPVEGRMRYYRLDAISDSRFNLYNALRLFYDNGGATAYIVSVGDYTGSGAKPEGAGVSLQNLEAGLTPLAGQTGPTMLVVPDAVLLPNDGDGSPSWKSSAFGVFAKKMIRHCGSLGDRLAILDVYGTLHADAKNLEEIVIRFHRDVGDDFLSYAASYFPFLHTTIVPPDEVSYWNVAGSSQETLTQILTWENANRYNNGAVPSDGEKGSAKYEEVRGEIGMMTSADANVAEVNAFLLAALPVLGTIETIILNDENVLPSSGALAGVYTANDALNGVWNAPANVDLLSVTGTTFKLNDAMQGEMNVPIDGKGVNAIREFVGRGTLVWGARTMDGNSDDWRYIQVRRTIIYIEQSIKNTLNQFVFAANDGATWATVTAMISNFLQNLWNAGGLMGASASDAYKVQCGLGSTMTAQDILEGYMIVQVTLQMIHPAEFIELTFRQRMEGV